MVAITKTRTEGGAERYLTVTPRVRPHATRTVVGPERMGGPGDLQAQAQVYETPLPPGITLHTQASCDTGAGTVSCGSQDMIKHAGVVPQLRYLDHRMDTFFSIPTISGLLVVL